MLDMSHVTHCNDSVKVIAVLSSYHVHINRLEKLIGFAIKMAGNQLIYLVAFRNQIQQQLLAPMQQVLIYLLLNLPICKPGIKTHRRNSIYWFPLYFKNLYESLHVRIGGSLNKAEFLEPNHTIFGGDIASSIMMMDTLIKLQSAEFGDLTVSFLILFESKNFRG